MKLIALLIALGLERLVTQLFHLRELRWLDRLFDPCLKLIDKYRPAAGWLLVALAVAVFVLPVYFLRVSVGDSLFSLPYLALSVGVLFFSLGPQDIGEEVTAWCDAIEAGDQERAAHLAKALLERDPRVNSRIDEAIFIQANNRIFAVVFWFVVFGPVGAWAFRVADLFRRRAVFAAQRNEAPAMEHDDTDVIEEGAGVSASVVATDLVHSLIAWIPARITALSYALAGSFDTGRDAWDLPPSQAPATSIGDRNEDLLARVGTAALAFTPANDESEEQRQVRNARSASSLVFRALIFWATAVAALTLFAPAI